MSKAGEYGVSIRMTDSDGAAVFEARVAELPDVVAFGETYNEAYEAALEAVSGLQDMYAAKGKTFPKPNVSEPTLSGRVTLRMSKSLHRSVHACAQNDGVSLNQWIVEAVAVRAEQR